MALTESREDELERENQSLHWELKDKVETIHKYLKEIDRLNGENLALKYEKEKQEIKSGDINGLLSLNLKYHDLGLDVLQITQTNEVVGGK